MWCGAAAVKDRRRSICGAALSGQIVHIAWFDRRDAGVSDMDVENRLNRVLLLLGLDGEPPLPRDPAVYYLEGFMPRVQPDQGGSWQPDVRLTHAAGQSELSSIGVSQHAVHVVWIDGRDGSPQLYYKRGDR